MRCEMPRSRGRGPGTTNAMSTACPGERQEGMTTASSLGHGSQTDELARVVAVEVGVAVERARRGLEVAAALDLGSPCSAAQRIARARREISFVEQQGKE